MKVSSDNVENWIKKMKEDYNYSIETVTTKKTYRSMESEIKKHYKKKVLYIKEMTLDGLEDKVNKAANDRYEISGELIITGSYFHQRMVLNENKDQENVEI